MKSAEIKAFLEEKVIAFNHEAFIENDPIIIPHQFEQKEDIEIIGFIVATIAWGNRASIIKNGYKLMEIMGNQPYEFIKSYNQSPDDLTFVHRTFNNVDLDFFFRSLQNIYLNKGGLESVFSSNLNAKESIMHFREVFLEVPHEKRSEKHLANPEKGSSAKRINMFLRWMVRNDKKGVDFGLWTKHDTAKLYIPLDVHTANAARKLKLIKRNANDWKALEELMLHLQRFDPKDPCKYDYALFGVSINKEI
ncbi:TIGR02757 family protein [Paracrocinitomix mangrovi]|uniref:TIGR02757 family protein n=1 Tax=Paracrocinitomix mangrovi TaxID=2862509 RepID=UPI001C8DB74B|nr:TIGR02757 family protein [Paracrocinitomix mangrovi]UKN02371.1 TIGR02757 family protein [Paracrocinitomix mangrovi]